MLRWFGHVEWMEKDKIGMQTFYWKASAKQLLDSLEWWREGKINAYFRKRGFYEGSWMDISRIFPNTGFYFTHTNTSVSASNFIG